MTENTSGMQSCIRHPVTHYRDGEASSFDDVLAVEEPLEIRVRWRQQHQEQDDVLTLTMRTPGHDLELAAGLLFSEGIVRQREHIKSIVMGDNDNVVLVELAPGHQLDMKRYQRHFYSHSGCGVCGKMAIESLRLLYQPSLIAMQPVVPVGQFPVMLRALRQAQSLFAETGGVHAAALFSVSGELLLLREDIGRHNAVDKLLGAYLLSEGAIPDDSVLFVSGRAGFEIVQKALAANIAVLAAIGAPSSLAVNMARDAGMTLIGFVKPEKQTCYSGEQRIATS
ncbi:MAG: formate dehydrogenase accessory sulfurtransferase FdhD [Pseudomonadales bacterium]|nr:formate dehydrogenase accessory sulfurtransferase FdhD [Pseudomonadales bacterium]